MERLADRSFYVVIVILSNTKGGKEVLKNWGPIILLIVDLSC